MKHASCRRHRFSLPIILRKGSGGRRMRAFLGSTSPTEDMATHSEHESSAPVVDATNRNISMSERTSEADENSIRRRINHERVRRNSLQRDLWGNLLRAKPQCYELGERMATTVWVPHEMGKRSLYRAPLKSAALCIPFTQFPGT